MVRHRDHWSCRCYNNLPLNNLHKVKNHGTAHYVSECTLCQDMASIIFLLGILSICDHKEESYYMFYSLTRCTLVFCTLLRKLAPDLLKVLWVAPSKNDILMRLDVFLHLNSSYRYDMALFCNLRRNFCGNQNISLYISPCVRLFLAIRSYFVHHELDSLAR